MKRIVFYLNIITALFLLAREIVMFVGDRSLFTLIFVIYLFLLILPELIGNRYITTFITLLSPIIILYLNSTLLIYLIPFHISRLTLNLKGKLFCFSHILYLIPYFFIPIDYFFIYSLTISVLIIVTLWLDLILRYCKTQGKIIDRLETENSQLSKKIISNRDYDLEREYHLKLEERSKIAQKLHDDLGHTISGSIFQLEAAKILLDSDLPRATKMIDNVTEVLNRGINTIRDSLKVIKPSENDIGLQSIKRVLREFEAKNSIKVYIGVNGDQSTISSREWFIVLSNLKEALTNILKYSEATEVNFTIDVFNKITKITVHDNGVGCKIIKSNMGITGMEERMLEVGGTLIIDGSNGFSATMLFKRADSEY